MSDVRGGPPPTWPGPPARPRNGFGTAALVTGIIGLVLAVLVIGLPFGVAAVVLGVIGLRLAGRGEATNRGVAIGGIVTGILAIAFSGLLFAAGVAFFVENEDEIDNLTECLDEAATEQEAEDCAEEFERDVEPGR
jgi:hypothetical protein